MNHAAEDSNAQPLVSMQGIGKSFGPVRVLEDVDFEIYPGEVHVLAGENGAGKSTLIKILGGVHTSFDGTIQIGGRKVRPGSPQAAAALGVAVIHQELSLVPTMSVADNLFLGRSITSAGFVCDSDQRSRARQLLGDLGVDVDPTRLVEELPIGTQQLAEIAKALAYNAKVIVMDEPTSALTAPEVDHLFARIEELKAQGCGIVYISHKMEEIERIANRITVLRDGQLVGTAPASELPPAEMVRWMIGREVGNQFPRHVPHLGDQRLLVRDLVVPNPRRGGVNLVDRVSLEVRAGEILGIGGLQGSGASQLLHGLFDARRQRASGEVWIDGRWFYPSTPAAAIRRGLALLTSDRKTNGLVLSLSITANSTLTDLRRLSSMGWRQPSRERTAAQSTADTLALRPASFEMPVSALSGGNQQKVALAKWLQIEPRILLLDEPTRGIDVGAKHEIYELLNQWTAQGIAIVLITSEMPELLAMSDRIVVMHRGRVTAELAHDEATADRVLEAAMGEEAVTS